MGLHTTNVAKAPEIHIVFLLVHTTGWQEIQPWMYWTRVISESAKKALMQKISVCISSRKPSWPHEVHGWTLTCHKPEQELFSKQEGQRTLPTHKQRQHRCSWHQCHTIDPGQDTAQSPGVVSASTKPLQFLHICTYCVKKMLNPRWNATNAPAVNIFRFFSLKNQKTSHLKTGEITQYGYTELYHSLIQCGKRRSTRSCQSLRDSPYWNHHRRETQL